MLSTGAGRSSRHALWARAGVRALTRLPDLAVVAKGYEASIQEATGSQMPAYVPLIEHVPE